MIKPSGGLLDYRGLAECNESDEVLPCPWRPFRRLWLPTSRAGGTGRLAERPDRQTDRRVAFASGRGEATPSGKKRGAGGCEEDQDYVRDDLLDKMAGD